MKQPVTKILIVTLLLIAGFITWILFIIIGTDYSSAIPKEKSCPPHAYFNLYPHLSNWDKSAESFPYQIYLDSADRCDLNSISNDVGILDSVNPDAKSHNQEIISIALTTKLQERIETSLVSYNPDTLISLVQWAEKFNQCKEIDQSNAKLYRVIYKHWINYVSNKLRTYYDSVPNHKYDFKFKYLVAICQSKNLAPPIGNTDKEKIVFNLIDKNYSYLFSKFWYDTSFIYKILGFVALGITVYGYYCIIKIHFKK